MPSSSFLGIDISHMWLLVVFAFVPSPLFSRQREERRQPWFRKLRPCRRNADCTLPEVCCDGPILRYCCDLGGTGARWRWRGDNASVPEVLWPPVPVPV